MNTIAILPHRRHQAVGKSGKHRLPPGTLTLTAPHRPAVWTGNGLSVARAGIRKLVTLNSRGGNIDLISIVGRALRVRAGVYVGNLGWRRTVPRQKKVMRRLKRW